MFNIKNNMSDIIPLLNVGLCLDTAKLIRQLRRNSFRIQYIMPIQNKLSYIYLMHRARYITNYRPYHLYNVNGYIWTSTLLFRWRYLDNCEIYPGTQNTFTEDYNRIMILEINNMQWRKELIVMLHKREKELIKRLGGRTHWAKDVPIRRY